MEEGKKKVSISKEPRMEQIPCIRILVETILKGLLRSSYYCLAPRKLGGSCIYAGEDASKRNLAPGTSYIHITEQDEAELVNLAIAVYLDEWLENDTNAREPLNYFSVYGFCPVNEQERHISNKTNFSARSKLNTAKKKFEAMMALQKEQADREQVGWNQEYTFKKKDKKLISQSSDDTDTSPKTTNGGRGKPFTFVNLCFIDWIANGYFSFYDLLVHRKKLLEVTTPKKKPNEALRDSYTEYFQKINSLKHESNNRTYVISAMMIQQIESTFHHMTAVHLAQGAASSSELTFQDVMDITAPWWGRFQYPSSVRRTIEHTQDKLYDILDYKTMCRLIQWKNCEKSLQNAGQPTIILQTGTQQIINHQIIKRSLLLDTMRIMNGLYPPKLLPKWEKEDYNDAAEFFKTNYPIIEQHSSVRLPPPKDWSDEMLNNIRKFYEAFLPFGLDELRKKA